MPSQICTCESFKALEHLFMRIHSLVFLLLLDIADKTHDFIILFSANGILFKPI